MVGQKFRVLGKVELSYRVQDYQKLSVLVHCLAKKHATLSCWLTTLRSSKWGSMFSVATEKIAMMSGLSRSLLSIFSLS